LIFNDLGVISGFDLTSEAALTKLHYLHARRTPIERLADGIMRPLAGEITSRGRDGA
jgi:L-asparaginase